MPPVHKAPSVKLLPVWYERIRLACTELTPHTLSPNISDGGSVKPLLKVNCMWCRFTGRSCHVDADGELLLFVSDGVVVTAEHWLHLLRTGGQVWQRERERDSLSSLSCYTTEHLKVFFLLRSASPLVLLLGASCSVSCQSIKRLPVLSFCPCWC